VYLRTSFHLITSCSEGCIVILKSEVMEIECLVLLLKSISVMIFVPVSHL
jgi:hypothetical protein